MKSFPSILLPTPQHPQIRRLILSDFRSYAALDLELSPGLIVLTGENGAGKTNILEALSLFTPGRGLRRADLFLCARSGGSGGFSISIAVDDGDGLTQLGTGYDPEGGARKYRMNGASVSSARAFADYARFIWMTPAMDGLFMGAAGERRRFLDRLVLAVDPAHGARTSAFERALRNRNRLLEDFADSAWLDACERELAELGVALTAARSETVDRLAVFAAEGRSETALFPWADLALQGDLENWLRQGSALQAEEAYRAALLANRRRDQTAGRTLIGPQASELAVKHGPKQIEARLCSTGEQKALLTGLILAHAQLVAAIGGMTPIILLDEIAAHFDPARRSALFAALEGLNSQVWLTGADVGAFAELDGRALHINVREGHAALAAREKQRIDNNNKK